MSFKLQDEEIWLRFAEQMAGQKVNGRHHSNFHDYIALTHAEIEDICDTADTLLQQFRARFRTE